MRNKLFTLILALVATFGAIRADVHSGTCGASLTWSLNTEDSTLTIEGTGAMQDYAYSTSMPWYSYWPKVKRIILPDGLTTIGKRAFTNCGHLKSINIPEGVISIGDFAFGQCMALPSVDIPGSVTSIGEYIFEGCDSLTAINIDEANTVYSSKDGVLFDKIQQTLLQYPIGRRAIEYTVPEGVITIGKSAFEHDTIIEHIFLPQTLQAINSRAFVWCKRLQEIDIPNSVIYMSDNLFGACMELRRVTLPTGINGIEEYMFNGCPIESIIIPEGITSIGTYAFGWCDHLKKVLLPSTLVTIHDNAFSSCMQLSEIICNASTPPVFASSETAFYDVDKSNCILYVPEASIELYQMAPQWGEFNIQAIQNEEPTPCITASGTCGEKITWELSCDSVLTISGTGEMDGSPFKEYLTSIAQVKISEGVISIGDRTFYDCTSLRSVEIPNSITNIGDYTFWGCNSLKQITIPSNIINIGERAFSACIGLVSIIMQSQVPPTIKLDAVGLPPFDDYYPIFIPCGTMEDYLLDWQYNSNLRQLNFQYLTLPYTINVRVNVKEAGSVTYSPNSPTICDNLQVTAIPNNGYNFIQWSDGVTDNPRMIVLTQDTSITAEFELDKCITASGNAGDNVQWELTCEGVLYFKGSGKMQDLGVQYYGFDPSTLPADNWYFYKSQVKEVVIEEGITSVGSFAFLMFENLQKATLPSSVTSIGASAFWFDTNLENVTLPSSLQFIDQQAFEGCDGFTEIIIPKSVQRIEGSAFSGCRNVTTVVLPDEVGYIGHGVFRLDEKITEPIYNSHTFAYLPENYSGTYIIPDGIINIAGGAMIACKEMDSLYIPNTVETIGMGAFMDCQALRHLTIPASVVYIDGDALFNLLGLKYITMLGSNPPDISAAAFDGYDASFPIYIPKGSKTKYLLSPYWNERNLIEMEEEEPVTDYTINYIDKDENIFHTQNVQLDLPEPPVFAGFTFVQWVIKAGYLTDGINIVAIYEYTGDPTDAPAVVANPSNPAQKLIRNGNVYILTSDKTYTITGQEVK